MKASIMNSVIYSNAQVHKLPEGANPLNGWPVICKGGRMYQLVYIKRLEGLDSETT